MRQQEILQTNKKEIERLFQNQINNRPHLYTQNLSTRIKKLKALKKSIEDHEHDIYEALQKDFKKPVAEVGMSELWPVYSEISHAIKNLKSWTKAEKVSAPLSMIGTSAKVIPSPKGVVLVIAPWNFPINLTLGPVISAISAGNSVIIKPSEISENSAAVMQKIIDKTFDNKEVALVQGAIEETQLLLSLPFDHIFFTGSTHVGKIVMQKAAEHLTSVTLELGGKSPVLIDSSADIKDAAKKIVWGKFMNAGQTCVAPDYILVDESISDIFYSEIVNTIEEYYGDKPVASSSYARIISDKHFNHVKHLLDDAIEKGATVINGGEYHDNEKYVSPTIFADVQMNMDIMKKEIFGPLLPILTYKDLDEVWKIIKENPNPLASYVFSQNKRIRKNMEERIPAGALCINECVIHYAHLNLPFGGLRTSGMGSSHGYYGFRAFSNFKSVLKQRRGLTNMSLLYPPYTKKTRKLVNWLTKYL